MDRIEVPNVYKGIDILERAYLRGVSDALNYAIKKAKEAQLSDDEDLKPINEKLESINGWEEE